MARRRLREIFRSESAWPFTLKQQQVRDCAGLLGAGTSSPILVRVRGTSGTGKSFFCRELLSMLSRVLSEGAGIYLDVPAAELEATDCLNRIDHLLVTPRKSTRDSPSFVSIQIARKWRTLALTTRSRRAAYMYRVVRDLSGQIPVAGPFVKAFLPASISLTEDSGPRRLSALRFLIKESRKTPIVVVVDNIQFLPQVVRDILDGELVSAGKGLRIVLIERIRGNDRISWIPPIDDLEIKDVVLGPASTKEIAQLIAEVLPDEEAPEQLAAVIRRRSEGNLKSVWFQLRFIAERRSCQDPGDRSVTYEGVIRSLKPVEQAILRVIVFLLGGLSIADVVELLEASDLRLGPGTIATSLSELAAIGLVVVNSDNNDRVRVEHEIVSHVVSDLTSEEDKLELRAQLVAALSQLITSGTRAADDDLTLYDRLLGIINEHEVRASSVLQSHIVSFLHEQHVRDRYPYLASIAQNSVCWDVLDILPEHSIRCMLNAIQKCSLFSFGLVVSERLRRNTTHKPLALLYEAKYLVQLFRYDDARRVLDLLPASNERGTIAFTIMTNLCQDERAGDFALEVYQASEAKLLTEQECVVLRNSGHLFAPDLARSVLLRSVNGFRCLGARFGVATALNNLGIVEVFAGQLGSAREHLHEARGLLQRLDSPEVYQPLVNLSALLAYDGLLDQAGTLLAMAQEAAPTSLAMDSVMLRSNRAALSILRDELPLDDALRHFQKLHLAASRTRDIRFVEVLGWFCAELEQRTNGAATTNFSASMIRRVRDSGNVGIELFLPAVVDGRTLDVPYVLSPHWRY